MGFHLAVSAYWDSIPTVADMVIVIETSDNGFEGWDAEIHSLEDLRFVVSGFLATGRWQSLPGVDSVESFRAFEASLPKFAPSSHCL